MSHEEHKKVVEGALKEVLEKRCADKIDDHFNPDVVTIVNNKTLDYNGIKNRIAWIKENATEKTRIIQNPFTERQPTADNHHKIIEKLRL